MVPRPAFAATAMAFVMALVISAATLLAAGVLRAEQTAPAPSAPPRPVVSEIVSPQISDATTYIGTVVARVETNLGFPLSGTLAARPVEVGSVVRKGDMLAQLDPEKLDADVWAAKAGVTVAQQGVTSARDAAERTRELLARGVEDKAHLQEAERALAAAQARLTQAEASLARADDLRNTATLRAPQDGIVTAAPVEAGAAVSAGQTVVRLAGTQDREVTIDLTDRDVSALPPDTVFETVLLANPEIRVKARLRSVDPVADRTTRTRRVHLSLEQIPGTYRLGALIRVSPVGNAQSHITVPASAVRHDEGAVYVWRIERPAGVLHKVAVRPGAALGARVIILSGLQQGDEVLTKGIHSVRDGQIVGPRAPE